MSTAQILALSRLYVAEVARWQAIAEHDAAIVAAIRAGIPQRQIASVAGVNQASISRRASRLDSTPTQEVDQCS